MRNPQAIELHAPRIIGTALLLAYGAMLCTLAPERARAAGETAQPAIEREVIPGAERMTPEQRETYRQRMAAAKTAAEKERIRAEYAQNQKQAAPLHVGDPARGAQLHRACFSCHGIERYTTAATDATTTFIDAVLRASGLSDLPPPPAPSKARAAKSIADLRAGVVRRNDYLNPKLTPQEIEDVVAYLNATYYHFPQ